MRGLTLDAVGEITYRTDLPDPELCDPRDVIVRVARAGLCGSDLHAYLGRESTAWGVVPGHEVVGEVVATGDDVRTVSVGDRVLVPFTLSCGVCAPCRRGLTSRCVESQLLGWGPPGDGDAILHGGQAEHVRVPLADGSLVPVPDLTDDTAAVLLCDNMPTGWYAAERASLADGDVVGVVGLGSVGLCAVVAAFAMGASQVIAVDPVHSRREQAALLGATVASPGEVDGLEVDAVIEAAGPPEAQALAARLARPGGTLSIIAVQTAPSFGVSPVLAYDRNLTIRTGRAPVRAVLDRLLPRITSGEVELPADIVVTHPDVALSHGPDAYRRFAAREDGMVKVVFAP